MTSEGRGADLQGPPETRRRTQPRKVRAAGAPESREWRQLQVLSRDAVRRLINAALFARESDPFGFAIWMLALLSTPPSFYAVHQLIGYSTLRFMSPAVIDRTIIGDRLFFVTYAMAAAFLLASLLWDTLFPDRAEQEILGVLPVRPRTAAAARLSAALQIGVVSALGVNGPAAVIFMFAAASHLGLWSAHLLLAGHLLSTLLASVSIFLLLLAIRGVLAVAVGARFGGWMSLVLQFVAVVTLVELFFFLPALLDTSARTMLRGGSAGAPPVWFASLFSRVAGDPRPAFGEPTRLALIAPVALAAAVAPLYLLSGARVGRRLLETQEHHRPARLVRVLGALATAAGMRPQVRALFLFAVASLTRSRQHLLILTTYLSLAMALTVFRVVVLGLRRPPTPRGGPPARLAYDASSLLAPDPSAGLLAIPLILLFFVVFGLRASFRVPTDAAANWPFRLQCPPAGDCARATWWTMAALGLFPVIALTLTGAVLLWPLPSALAVAGVTAASGLLLVEIALRGETSIPFACEHGPSSETVKWKWIAFVAGLVGFAFLLSPLEAWAAQSASGTALYAGTMLLIAAAIRVEQRQRRERAEIVFEEGSADSAAVLNLSEAIN